MTKRRRKDDARSFVRSLTDDQLRGFDYDHERFAAKRIAELYRANLISDANRLLKAVVNVENCQRIGRLIDAELKGKRTKSDLRAVGFNILRAYGVARCNATDIWPGFAFGNPDDMVTFHEVKCEYARLFVKEHRPRNMTARAWLASLEKRNKIPRHKTFRETLTRYGAEICKDRRGAPRK